MGKPSGRIWKCTLGGKISDSDGWSINTWWREVAFTVIPTQADTDAIATGLLADFNSKFWNPATNPYKAVNAAATTVVNAKVYAYVDGVLTYEASSAVTAIPGTSSNAQPAYCAQVFSLRTPFFGRSARGRLYMPRTGVSNSGSTLQYTNTQAHVDNLASWLGGATYNSGNISIKAIVLSEVKSAGYDVVEVRMDSLPDTQRGRISSSLPTSTMLHSVP